MIVSLFGPDGIGKSTVSKMLSHNGWFVFSGTGVASWPDQTWYDDLTSRGIDETVLGDDEHFFEKIRRCHAMARQLEETYGRVVIDSDPLHKTFMHDIIKGRFGEKRTNEIWNLAYPNGVTDTTHVQLKLSCDDLRDAGVILQRRISQRGELAPFDPRSQQESEAAIVACDELAEYLQNRGEKVMKGFTDTLIDVDQLVLNLGGKK